jgi:hypothetical protein
MNETLHKAGFWSALVAFTAVAGQDVAQSLQIIGVLRKPYDEIFIYGSSLFIAVPFMLTLLSRHYLTPDDKKFWSHGAEW